MRNRRKSPDFASEINRLFGLQEQAKKLVTLMSKTLGCERACLLFLDSGGEDFTVKFCQPKSKGNPLSRLSLSRQNPIVEYLGREKKLLKKKGLATLPEFRGLWMQDSEEIKFDEVELFMPLISRDRLIGILALGRKQDGRYSVQDFSLLESIIEQVAISMEKEYLREQLAQLYTEAAERARLDGLTGLLNRRSLDEAIASEINRHSRYGGAFSLIVLDLDAFKAFNDSHGHLAGDNLLRRISGVMRNSIRSADQAFRYGGDEFAILLPNTSVGAAKQVAERTRKQVASEVVAGSVPVTISLGLASWPTNGRSANEIISAADAALYQAKQSGGNQSRCA